MQTELGAGLFALPNIVGERRTDGSLVLRSAEPLADHPPTLLASFRVWCSHDPDHVLARQRDESGAWRTLTYGEADRQSRAIGQALLDLGLGPARPLMVISENSLEHLVVVLAALCVGVPVSPTSVAYSLQSKDHGRIKELAGLLNPGAVFAADAVRFRGALDALNGIPAIVAQGQREGAKYLSDLAATTATATVDAAYDALGTDSVAKILFTSGSTGSPKGVITTHGMLAANQQMMRQAWPFLASQRPVIVDWLPWSHTFGGSHNLGMILVNGGTLYIDGGRPVPGAFDQTIRNLAEVAPTVYFNVPAGFAQLVPALESDEQFAAQFFSELRLLFNAAAALPDGLRNRLQAVAVRTTGREIPVTGSWGLTETAPAVTNAHYPFLDARTIGVPLPGADLLLLPSGADFEIRVRGPMVTPGYLDRPDLTSGAFDDEGFYLTGDAVQLADPENLNLGLLFKGRLAEDFKLTTGTFVRVGAVRTALLSSLPVLGDAAIAGENEAEVCALAWVNPVEARKLLGRDPEVKGETVIDAELAKVIARALGEHARTQGAAGRIERLVLMSRPADLDAGEITDKGYVNQRKVLASRPDLLALLYSTEPSPAVIAAERNPQ